MEMPQRYQVNFFCDLDEVSPEASLIMKLNEAFKEHSLVSSSFQEFVFDGNTTTTKQRLILTTERKDFVVRFDKNAIIFEQVRHQDFEMPSLDKYLKKVKEVFKIINDNFSIKGKRLSFLFTCLLKEMEKKDLEKTYHKILIPNSYYAKQKPFEWNTRQVALSEYAINKKKEKINVITQINRSQGTLTLATGKKNVDRILYSSDINTNQENMNPRFDLSDFEIFLDKSYNQFVEIKKDFEEILNGD